MHASRLSALSHPFTLKRLLALHQLLYEPLESLHFGRLQLSSLLGLLRARSKVIVVGHCLERGNPQSAADGVNKVNEVKFFHPLVSARHVLVVQMVYFMLSYLHLHMPLLLLS